MLFSFMLLRHDACWSVRQPIPFPGTSLPNLCAPAFQAWKDLLSNLPTCVARRPSGPGRISPSVVGARGPGTLDLLSMEGGTSEYSHRSLYDIGVISHGSSVCSLPTAFTLPPCEASKSDQYQCVAPAVPWQTPAKIGSGPAKYNFFGEDWGHSH